MPTLLLSFKRVSDSEILIHGMLAPNDRRAARMLEEHAGICPSFGPVFKAGDTIEETVEVNIIPEFDREAIGEWIDTELLGEVEDEEEDDEEDEEEEGEDEAPSV
jgi:hypothetical protein